MEPPQCGPSKRARAPSSGIQVASCLVDGCNSDLSKCKDYHRRHKVCEAHSKAPRVTIGGLEQRFCQQCSRFHALVEFDGDKRSCRKRLDGHNKRRRKPQPDGLSLAHGRFMTNHPGAKFIPFGGPQMFPTGALERCSWPGAVKVESDDMPYHCHQIINFSDRNILSPGSFSGYKGQPPFQILQGADAFLPEPSTCKSVLDPNSISANGGSCHKLSANDSNSVITSDRALSLLSSPSTNTSETCLSHLMPPGQSSLAQSSISSLHNNRMRMNGDVNSAMMSGDGRHRSRYTYQMEIQGSSASEHHQTSSFTW